MKTAHIVFALFAFAANLLCAQPIKSGEFVFECPRFLCVHCATITENANKELICAWFGGKYEKSADTSIFVSRKIDGMWTLPKEVANAAELTEKRQAAWNPVLWKYGSDIILSYKIGDSPRTWRGFYKISKDGGKNWSEPFAYPDGILGPIKNKPLITESGKIIAPSSTEFHSSFGWFPHFEISDDGKNWRKSAPRKSFMQCIQPALVRTANGQITAFMRSRNGVVATTTTKDLGESWSNIKKTNLNNPNSGLDAVFIDGVYAIACNPEKSGRTKLAIMVSEDAENWKILCYLEKQPHGEYSYPSLFVDSDGNLHAVYTYNRRYIKHVKLDKSEIKQ